VVIAWNASGWVVSDYVLIGCSFFSCKYVYNRDLTMTSYVINFCLGCWCWMRIIRWDEAGQ